jgi:1-aminocyclopropane-1-carboxylate deaminase/D-cysteine desulfhydrase-like pyridoxal-dependent ACC family enzyme
MRTTLILALATTVAISGCARVAESHFNPLNWFGTSQTTATPVDADGNRIPLVQAGGAQEIDARVLIDSVESMVVQQTSFGAIVRATGTAATQGAYNAELVPVRADAGTLTLAFRVEAVTGTAQGGTLSRRIVAAKTFSQGELAGVSRIAVQGQRNAQVSSR